MYVFAQAINSHFSCWRWSPFHLDIFTYKNKHT